MKIDPNVLCGDADERVGWAIVHDLVAHPLLALTGYCAAAVAFHDWTSRLAWPSARRSR